MKYWEDMDTKYGFGDGAAIPPDAEQCRTVYITAMNTILEKKGSTVRVVAFNRGGAHNSCLILKIDREQFIPDQATSGEHPDHKETLEDDGYEQAVVLANELDLDQYVKVSVSVDQEALDQALAEFV